MSRPSDVDDLKRRLQIIEHRWLSAKHQLRIARDWRVEAQLHFELIDLNFAHKRILSLISSLSASTDA
jgi:hypothetical protein